MINKIEPLRIDVFPGTNGDIRICVNNNFALLADLIEKFATINADVNISHHQDGENTYDIIHYIHYRPNPIIEAMLK